MRSPRKPEEPNSAAVLVQSRGRRSIPWVQAIIIILATAISVTSPIVRTGTPTLNYVDEIDFVPQEKTLESESSNSLSKCASKSYDTSQTGESALFPQSPHFGRIDVDI